jgi:Ni/Fe-hydrogenase 1 B-type cytochrome subunit
MWGFIFFSLIHIYLVFYHDWLEGRGEVSSMFGGYKFVRRKRIKSIKRIKRKGKVLIVEEETNE